MRRRIRIFSVCIFSLGAAAATGFRYLDRPVVTIENQSGLELSNITASGRGFSFEFHNLAIGEHRNIRPLPTGETGVRLSFDAKGRHVVTDQIGYFESRGFYRIGVTITPALTPVLKTN